LSQKYANRLDLDKLNVFVETDSSNPMYVQINGFPDIFTYGKHYGTLSIVDSPDSQYVLRNGSKLQIEAKDRDGTVIYTDVTDVISDSFNGAIVFYIWIKEDPLRTHKDIKNGTGTLTIVGELDNVPPKWKYKSNYRCILPIEIRKDLPNSSPILFQDINTIQLSSSFSESIDLDTGDSNYKRSYLNISASHLHTYGGKVDKIEASYRETRAQNNEYKVLTTYPLSSSVYEITASNSKGLNPISDLQKFPVPRDIRREGDIEFRLRFLNSNGEFAQDITQNNVDVQITGSITNYSGSALILETPDNLVTGSGAIMFGTTVNDGIRMTYDKTKESILMDNYVGGVRKGNIFDFSTKDGGSAIHDSDKNTSTESSGSAILAGEDNDIFQSSGSSVVSGIDNKITGSEASTIMAGDGNRISASKQSVIGGGVNNTIFGAGYGGIFSGKDNLIKTAGTGYVFNLILGGGTNQITSSGNSADKHNVIVGGSSNKIYTNTSDGSDQLNVIVGGGANKLEGVNNSYIGGGTTNQILGEGTFSYMYGVINGGFQNKIDLPGGAGFGPTIGGGYQNEITASTSGDFILNGPTIAGGYQNRIYSSEVDNKATFIGGGESNKIQESIYASILGGYSNTITNANSGSILGGTNNNLNHDNSFIIGSDITSTATNTTYVSNLSTSGDLTVAGKITAQEFHTEFTSASIIYSSGSTQFGDTIDDTHTFTGHITSSGNISASGTLISNELNISATDTSEDAVHYPLFKKAGQNLVNNTNGLFFKPNTDTLTLGNNGVVLAGNLGNITAAGNISGSGEVYAVSASFGSLTNTTNRWNDGWHGNDEFIAITPGDFTLTNNYNRGDEFPPYTSDDGGSIVPSSTAVNYYAIKMIPKGFTAIEVYIYSNSTDTISVFEGNIVNDTSTAKGTGNTNTTIDIIDVDGDGTNYIVIEWNPNNINDEIHGGKINIQRTV